MLLLSESPQPRPSHGPSIRLNSIRTASRDFNAIVNDMITLSCLVDTAMRDRRYLPHSIHELEQSLADEMLKAFLGDTRYNASIIFCHDLPLYFNRLRIDLGVLRDSLLPLVVNAIQNTSEGSVVVSVSILRGCMSLVVDVKETGSGITAITINAFWRRTRKSAYNRRVPA